jgi:hypothetical protein
MKIESNPLLPVQQGETHRKPLAGGVEGFDTLLAEQLQNLDSRAGIGPGLNQAGSTAAALAMQIQSAQMLGGLRTDEVSEDADALVFDRVNGLLDKWDAYAATLAGSKGNLREAFGMLQSMNDELGFLKEAMPDFTRQGTGLASLMNELDVLAATETFKFNRGDYL